MQIQAKYKQKKVNIFLKKNLVFSKRFENIIKKINKKLVIITDKNVSKFYREKFEKFLNEINYNDYLFIEISPGEKNKTRETIYKLQDTLLKNKINKSSTIIAFGGGVISDISGFLASTYFRGISLITIPTTFLSMIDASIGGKNGININNCKNIIGTIYHSDYIFIDPNFLTTLPLDEIQSGIAEAIKYGILFDRDLFDYLYQNPYQIDYQKVIERCIKFKIDITIQDETDKNIRNILNFGHTIGHSLETLSNFSISHGKAIAIGMIIESFFSKKLSKKQIMHIFSIFKKWKFPLTYSDEINWKMILETVYLDKKMDSFKTPKLIFLRKIGQIEKNKKLYLHNVDENELKKHLIWLQKRFIKKN